MCWVPHTILCVTAKMLKGFFAPCLKTLFIQKQFPQNTSSLFRKRQIMVRKHLPRGIAMKEIKMFSQKKPLQSVVQSVLFLTSPWLNTKLYGCQYSKGLFPYITCLFLEKFFEKSFFHVFAQLLLRCKELITNWKSYRPKHQSID